MSDRRPTDKTPSVARTGAGLAAALGDGGKSTLRKGLPSGLEGPAVLDENLTGKVLVDPALGGAGDWSVADRVSVGVGSVDVGVVDRGIVDVGVPLALDGTLTYCAPPGVPLGPPLGALPQDAGAAKRGIPPHSLPNDSEPKLRDAKPTPGSRKGGHKTGPSSLGQGAEGQASEDQGWVLKRPATALDQAGTLATDLRQPQLSEMQDCQALEAQVQGLQTLERERKGPSALGPQIPTCPLSESQIAEGNRSACTGQAALCLDSLQPSAGLLQAFQQVAAARSTLSGPIAGQADSTQISQDQASRDRQPPTLACCAGSVVQVSVGKRQVWGVVWRVHEEPSSRPPFDLSCRPGASSGTLPGISFDGLRAGLAKTSQSHGSCHFVDSSSHTNPAVDPLTPGTGGVAGGASGGGGVSEFGADVSGPSQESGVLRPKSPPDGGRGVESAAADQANHGRVPGARLRHSHTSNKAKKPFALKAYGQVSNAVFFDQALRVFLEKMAAYTLTPLGLVIKMALPSLDYQAFQRYRLNPALQSPPDLQAGAARQLSLRVPPQKSSPLPLSQQPGALLSHLERQGEVQADLKNAVQIDPNRPQVLEAEGFRMPRLETSRQRSQVSGLVRDLQDQGLTHWVASGRDWASKARVRLATVAGWVQQGILVPDWPSRPHLFRDLVPPDSQLVSQPVSPPDFQMDSQSLLQAGFQDSDRGSELESPPPEREQAAGAAPQDAPQDSTPDAFRSATKQDWEAALPQTLADQHRAFVQTVTKLALTPAQTAALQAIQQGNQTGKPVLLQGVTGSGKTEVLIGLCATIWAQGGQVLVLLPEIALAPQWLQRIERYFRLPMGPWHSDLTPAVRAQTYQQIASGQQLLTVGTRSALMLPYQNLGLIVVDEEHETAYKQTEGVLYHGRDMALLRAHTAQIPIVLASATPSLESCFHVAQGRFVQVCLQDRFGQARLPEFTCLDRRTASTAPLAAFSEGLGGPGSSAVGMAWSACVPAGSIKKNQWITPALRQVLQGTLERGEQSLLFLNRRGYALLCICFRCGFRAACRQCSVWMAVHHKPACLMCHYCGAKQPIPSSCPQCQNPEGLTMMGPGIERLEAEVHGFLPDARTALLSSDHLQAPKALQTTLQAIVDRQVDVIIGTQLIAKGHHFPGLTTIGIVDTDFALDDMDFRSSERLFQVLAQVTGRAGRAELPGHVYVQTTWPDHPLFHRLARHDWDGFVQDELARRRQHQLPPWVRMVALTLADKDPLRAESAALIMHAGAPQVPDLMVMGPAPAPISPLRGYHRMRFLLRSPRGLNVQALVRQWVGRCRLPPSTRLEIDRDPYHFL